MAVFAVIEAGVVTNLVLADTALEENWVEATDSCGIGWSYSSGQFTAPPEPALPAPTRESQEELRRSAYQQEADPLFFMSQRGEATVEEWQAKVAEIKARYPYPEETQA
jgi:hypothetical protein